MRVRSSCHSERSEEPLYERAVTLIGRKRTLQLRGPSAGSLGMTRLFDASLTIGEKPAPCHSERSEEPLYERAVTLTGRKRVLQLRGPSAGSLGMTRINTAETLAESNGSTRNAIIGRHYHLSLARDSHLSLILFSQNASNYEPLDWDFRISVPGMERNFLPGDTARQPDVALLRGTLFEHGSQLYFPANSQRQDH
jgi:hypothetical protein